jgi:hypothetical protein
MLPTSVYWWAMSHTKSDPTFCSIWITAITLTYYSVYTHQLQLRRSSSLRPREFWSEMRSFFTMGGVTPRSCFRFFTCTDGVSMLQSSTFSGLRVAKTKLREFLGPTTGPSVEPRVSSAILANAFWPRARKDPRRVTKLNGHFGSGDARGLTLSV